MTKTTCLCGGIFLMICACRFTQAADTRVQFGKDVISIPSTPTNNSDNDRERLLKLVPHIYLKQVANPKLPMRDGVMLFRGPYFLELLAKENDQYARVTIGNIGYFARAIGTAEECVALLSLLLEDSGQSISESAFKKIREVIKNGNSPEVLCLRILQSEVESESLHKGCVATAEFFFFHVLRIEDTSVIERKYVVDRKSNMIGTLSRVLIEGPLCPVDNGDEGPGSWSNEKKKKYDEWKRCYDFIQQIVAINDKRVAQ